MLRRVCCAGFFLRVDAAPRSGRECGVGCVATRREHLPQPSWGLMISEAKGYMFFSPWLITIPCLALFALVLAINLLGDGVRDVTAPEGRN